MGLSLSSPIQCSNKMICEIETMTWHKPEVANRDQTPSVRSHHSAVVHGHQFIVFGGLSGVQRMNDIHVLDLGALDMPP